MISLKTNAITTIIFDFDLTISKHHLHSECIRLLQQLAPGLIKHPPRIHSDEIEHWDAADINLLWRILHHSNRLLANGNPMAWQHLFMTLLDHHYQVFIASFSSFAPIIQRFLQEVIQLPESYIPMIHIEAWLPINQDNKNLHLDRIVSGTYIAPVARSLQQLSDIERIKHYQHLILIDDAMANINAVMHLVGERHVIYLSHQSHAPELIMEILSKRLNIRFIA